MQIIESYVEKYRLDKENLKFQQLIIAEKNGNVIGFGRVTISALLSAGLRGCLGSLSKAFHRQCYSKETDKEFPK